MKQFLTFAMVAPMASFGDIAVGERRDSRDHPARSAILGLVAACLGIERSDEEAHQALEADYGVAILSCGIGRSLVDYHTAQSSPSAQYKKKGIPRRRAEELAFDELGTILSRREYRTDVWHLGALWIRPESGAARWGLDLIENSMKEPYFTPYLGRRSCPLTLPLAPHVNEVSSVDRALLERHHGEEWKNASLSELYKRIIPRGSSLRLYVSAQDAGEVSRENGFKSLHNMIRRDALISRRRWQFGLREEAVFIHRHER